MSHPLADACRKVERAKRHLDEINDMFAEWHSLDPYRFVRDDDTNEGFHQFHVEVSDPLPDQLGIAIGEFAHQLRTALNQVIWQLSLLTSDSPKTTTTEFPIFWEFKSDDIRKRLRHVSKDTDARTIIRGLQPYHRGEDAKADLLWGLQQLNVVDKYQITQGLGLLMQYLFTFGGKTMFVNLTFRRVLDETPFAIPKLPMQSNDNIQIRLFSGVAVPNFRPNSFAHRETFQEMYDYVAGIVPCFERFFD